jgi:hypothetical protein
MRLHSFKFLLALAALLTIGCAAELPTTPAVAPAGEDAQIEAQRFVRSPLPQTIVGTIIKVDVPAGLLYFVDSTQPSPNGVATIRVRVLPTTVITILGKPASIIELSAGQYAIIDGQWIPRVFEASRIAVEPPAGRR